MKCAAAVIALALTGCTAIWDPPPKKPEPCQVWVRIDNGPWRCYARERVRRDLCKITAMCN